MTDKEAMKLALDALETECDIYCEHDEDGAPEYILEAITALKERLAQEKALQALHSENERLGLYKDAYATQEPVAWIKRSAKGNIIDLLSEPDDDAEPVYTTPPAAQRQPLTDEQIEDGWERITGHSIFGGNRTEGRAMYLSPDEVIEFARAIEAAHGIKENT